MLRPLLGQWVLVVGRVQSLEDFPGLLVTDVEPLLQDLGIIKRTARVPRTSLFRFPSFSRAWEHTDFS